MDGDSFDTLARSLTTSRSRRRLTRTILSLAFSSAAAASTLEQTAAKKKPCPPCKKRKKSKCKANLPDGTTCNGGTCRSGSCCVPEHPAATCAGARCGTARTNTCGQTVACTCSPEKSCLANGSCAIDCLESACPAGCFCSSVNTEGAKHCLSNDQLPTCDGAQDCSDTGTAGCPLGMHCQEAGCTTPVCANLCPS